MERTPDNDRSGGSDVAATVADAAPVDSLDGPGTDHVTTSGADAELGFFAGTRAGRVLLGAVLAFLSFTLVVWNLPDSEVRSEIRPALRPVVNAVAFDQSWSVFAPNPTTVSLAVEADVYLGDGEVIRYKFPHGDDLVGAYREYRWRKWERRVRLDRNDHLWEPTAEWVAAQFRDEDVTKVVLVRRFSDTPEPGSNDERVWESTEFFTLMMTDAGEGTRS
jgi:hypothetical protein